MKMCDEHWAALRAAIVDRGLGAFVAKSGEAVVDRLVADGFEPLMGAHNAIVSNGLNAAGLELMRPNDDGSERCPLCFLIAACPCARGAACPYRTWITRAADDQLAEAKRLGLVGGA